MRLLLFSMIVLVGCSASSGSGAGGGTAGSGGGASSDGGAGGGSGGGSTSDAGAPDAGPINTFVAIGYAGRTTVSCDDGQTWIANASEDDSIVCFGAALADGGSSDCDHNYSPGRGISYGNGWFVATFGWGTPGSIRRSRDGITWQRPLQGNTFASLIFGNGKFLAASRSPKVSSDDGLGWADGGEPMLSSAGTPIYNVRRGGFGGDAGVFVLVGEDGTARDTAISSTNGATWQRPTSIPANCGASIQWEGGIVDGAGVLLMVGGDGVVCRSVDNGQSWTSVALGTAVSSRLVWTGTEFFVWGGNKLFRSANGVAWISMATTLQRALPDGGIATETGPEIGPVARGPGGTFVAVNGGWQQWYDKQLFLRSTDGLIWHSLPKSKYTPSHPMTHIISGAATRSALCP